MNITELKQNIASMESKEISLQRELDKIKRERVSLVRLLEDFENMLELTEDEINILQKFHLRGGKTSVLEYYGKAKYFEELSEFLSTPRALTHDVEIQDNSYGGDGTPYTTAVQKGYSTSYHPCLFAIRAPRDLNDIDRELAIVIFHRVAKELETVGLLRKENLTPLVSDVLSVLRVEVD